jgi:pSer/pThr/pTyr-binding forkhead associated (FHA) protein
MKTRPEPNDISAAEIRDAGRRASITEFDGARISEHLREATATLQRLSLPAHTPVLVLLGHTPQETPTVFPINGRTIVGRGSSAHVQLADEEKLSRTHFAVEPADDSIVLDDLRSRNGTRINGRDTISFPYLLVDGDIIHAGGRRFLFVLNAPEM